MITDTQRIVILSSCLLVLFLSFAVSSGFAQSPATGFTTKERCTSLEEAFKDPKRVTVLILDRTPLKTLPKKIGELENLRVLILNRNNLTKIPKEIAKLTNLKSVYLGGSPKLNFTDVIKKLSRLPNLEGL